MVVIFGYSFYAPSAILVFSVTFLLTDIVNERFGKIETHKMIFIAFISQILMVLFLWFGTSLEPAPFWNLQGAWKSVFLIVPRITLASWVAFLVSENLDVVIYAWIRRKTNNKYLWMRNSISSIPMLLVDTLIFIPLAFYGLMPMMPLIIGQIILKWLVGLINIPFMYLNKYILSNNSSL